MIGRFWDRLFGRRIAWRRSIVELRNLEALARMGLAGLLLAQEKARLDFTRAREACERSPGRARRARAEESLAHLQATNAVVQSLVNERQLEQQLAEEQTLTECPVGKSR